MSSLYTLHFELAFAPSHSRLFTFPSSIIIASSSPSCTVAPHPTHLLLPMLNPQAPPFDYGGCSRQPVHGLQMDLSCSYPFLSTCASTSPLPVVPYSSHSLHHHYHYHYLPQYLTPSNISCYTCFPPLLPPLSPLPDLPSFPLHQPRRLKLEEIDEGDGLVPVMADSESKRSVFHLSKGQSLPCFEGRRRRGGGKRSAACWMPKVDGGLVVSNGHPIPRRSSELKHGGRIRARRGNAAAIAWVPKPKPFDVKEFEDDDEDRTTLMIRNIPNRFKYGYILFCLFSPCTVSIQLLLPILI